MPVRHAEIATQARSPSKGPGTTAWWDVQDFPRLVVLATSRWRGCAWTATTHAVGPEHHTSAIVTPPPSGTASTLQCTPPSVDERRSVDEVLTRSATTVDGDVATTRAIEVPGAAVYSVLHDPPTAWVPRMELPPK